MKKLWVIPLLALFLAGCGGEKTMETISDVEDAPVIATMQRVLVQMPQELSAPALQSEKTGTLYLCDDYSVTLQTVEAGDLSQTIRDATGMQKESLQIIETKQGDAKRYQWVWAVAGESGTQVGRGCILDDGAYHYVITAIADEEAVGRVQSAWKEIFSSFRLAEEREEVNTGS